MWHLLRRHPLPPLRAGSESGATLGRAAEKWGWGAEGGELRVFAPTCQQDAQWEQHSTAGWRQLKATLFLALPQHGVGCHRAATNRRDRGASVLGLARASGTHQTWIPPTFFRAKQPESVLTGS